MHKFLRKTMAATVFALGLAACGDDVTVTPPPETPETPNITSFSVGPATVTLQVGQTAQASYNLQTKPGVNGTVAWVSSAPAVATVSAAGVITAVAPGNASITGTATAGGQTAAGTIGVTVGAITPASVSIQSITAGLLTLPVNLSNVAGQIEINLNFNPGNQIIDSVVTYIGTKRAAVQTFSANTIPPVGPISMSVNTANYTKNPTAGTTTVDFFNGPTTVSAQVFPKNSGSQGAVNCTNSPSNPNCSTNTFSLVLNNVDGWAANVTKPTNVQISSAASPAPGQTFWGGPGTAGVVSAQLFPVIYTPGRSITTVTWTIGGCATVTQTALPFTRTWGYTAAPANAQSACTAYQWTGGNRDNVIVTNAIDNASNTYALPFAGLIPNTVVFASTPDSIRLDYVAPSVTTPTIARTAPAVTGWVNASFSFAPAASTDGGVGVRATADRAYTYTGCGATAVAMPTATGADIPECSTNFIGGTPGLGSPGTAPYRVTMTESDRLGNVGTSTATQTFGVDKTNPAIRFNVTGVGADTIFTASAPTGAHFYLADFIDERSGFNLSLAGTTAQRHSLARAGHAWATGQCIVAAAAAVPGATFVTDQQCALTNVTSYGGVGGDGWQAGMQVTLNGRAQSYHGYRTQVTDAAGNNSNIITRKSLIDTQAPFATGLTVPTLITNAGFNLAPTLADSVELRFLSMRLDYPNVGELRYPQQAIGTRFDDVITSPFGTAQNPPTGAPYVRRIEAVTGDVWPGVPPAPATNVAAAPVNVKPTAAMFFAFDVANPAFLTVSPLAAIFDLGVENGVSFNTFNTGNVTNRVDYWRVIPTVATTNQFNSTTPLRAQALTLTNTPNPPFVRVDFYRVDGGVSHYLGSSSAPIASDQGTFRSWVYALPTPYQATWDGTAQGTVVAGTIVRAVGVTAAGDGLATVATTMVP